MSKSYTLIKKDGSARRGVLHTVHGDIQTPVFMNVGTVAAIKGGVSTDDLRTIGTQVELSNTYHLHVRTGDETIKKLGGLHRFMNWDRPILTDSGGFQVFSLASLRKITERDECPPALAERSYVQPSVDRTYRWLVRCKAQMARLNSLEDTINKNQMLFGINQGAIYPDIRIEHAKMITELDLDGYAIGGLAVGESHEQMYEIIEKTAPYLPEDKPIYLMGVGTPINILEAVERGVDFFDCVYPSRNGRHGHVYTSHGHLNMFNAKYSLDERPIEEGCQCPACRSYSRAYIHHLMKAREMLGMRLCVLHNLYFYNHLMEEIRNHIEKGDYSAYKKSRTEQMKENENA